MLRSIYMSTRTIEKYMNRYIVSSLFHIEFSLQHPATSFINITKKNFTKITTRQVSVRETKNTKSYWLIISRAWISIGFHYIGFLSLTCPSVYSTIYYRRWVAEFAIQCHVILRSQVTTANL